MYLFKIILSLFIYILLISSYLLVSITVNLKGNIMVFLIISISLICFIILSFKGLVKKSLKIELFKRIGTIDLSIIALCVLVSMCFIEYGNFLILKISNQTISVYKIIKDSNKLEKDTTDYNKLFSSIKYDNNTVYFTPAIEPALKLVDVYLKKAAVDNLKLFGDITPSPLNIKFDYDEAVFKKRNSSFKDYAGLYYSKEKTIYIYIKDCYSDVLALNPKSAYMKNILLHEYTHHMFYEFMNSNQIPVDKIPVWFMEGISEYIGYEGAFGNQPKTLVDFNELNTKIQWTNYSNQSYSTYEQSHYAVSQLILMKGEKVIKEILLKTKDTDFNTAFNDTMGLSIENYEKSFKEDFKNNWEKYNKMIPPQNSDFYREIKIQCFEKYIHVNPNNINALMDLSLLYEGIGEIDKAKLISDMAVEEKPDSSMAWWRLALVDEEMNDFDGAIKAYEKVASIEEVSISESQIIVDINLAQVMLLKDMNKAAQIAQNAKVTSKSNFIRKQAQEVINFKNSFENSKPYEGCLQLIKSDTINSSNIKKALIEKMLKDYPLIRCEARSELEEIKSKL